MVALNGAQKFIRISSNLRTPLQVQGPSLSPFYRQGDRGSEGLRKCAVVGTAMRGTACGPGSRHPKARTTPPSDTELRGGLRAGPPHGAEARTALHLGQGRAPTQSSTHITRANLNRNAHRERGGLPEAGSPQGFTRRMRQSTCPY